MNSPPELVLVGEGDGVDEDVEAAELLLPLAEDALDVVVALHIAGLHEGRAEPSRKRLDAFLHEHLDRREADLSPLAMECLCDPPGDRVVVRQPEDQSALAFQQTHVRAYLPAIDVRHRADVRRHDRRVTTPQACTGSARCERTVVRGPRDTNTVGISATRQGHDPPTNGP